MEKRIIRVRLNSKIFLIHLSSIFKGTYFLNICALNKENYIQILLKKSQQLLPILKILIFSSIVKLTNLVDILVIDYPNQRYRFSLVYIFQCLFYSHRINLKLFLKENQSIDSLFSVFSGTVWYEREVWDMFGIFFINNPDLRRILTDYGFSGYPLRKDFPLSGFFEIRYDDTSEFIVYEPLELMQEFRNFEFLSPWESLVTTH